jgi:ABC-type transport system involved in multi-copper enzyme maturation permease subunit
MTVWILCANTFREAVRDRILYLLAVLSAVSILASKGIGWVSVGDDLKIVTDIGLMSLSVTGAMVVVFLGTGLIYKEVDKRTLYVILSRPVSRWEFVLGKYFGLLMTTLLIQAIMAVVFLGYLKLMTWLPNDPNLLAKQQVYFGAVIIAIVLSMMEMVMLTAVAILFSSASTPILSALFTTMLYALGHMAEHMEDLALILLEKGSAAGYCSMMIMSYVFPKLHVFNVRNEASHGLYGHFPDGYPWMVMLYCLLQTAGFLLLGVLAFRRRNF